MAIELLCDPLIDEIPPNADVLDYGYTDSLRKTILDANALAARRRSPSVDPEHFFLSISLHFCANAVLDDLGYCLNELQITFDKSFAGSDPDQGLEPPYTHVSVEVFEYAKKCAKSLKHDFLGGEHLLAALVEIESPVSTFLQSHGLSTAAVKQKVVDLLGAVE